MHGFMCANVVTRVTAVLKVSAEEDLYNSWTLQSTQNHLCLVAVVYAV